MECNKLKINGDKTEALVVDTRSRTSVCYNEHLLIGVVRFRFSPRLRVWELSSTLASLCLITLALSVVLPTLSCGESVPSVYSSLQVRPQLLSVLEFYLGLITSVVLPTLSCGESVPSVYSSLQVRPQLLSVLEFYLGLITAILFWQVSLQIRWSDFKEYRTTQLDFSFLKGVVSM